MIYNYTKKVKGSYSLLIISNKGKNMSKNGIAKTSSILLIITITTSYSSIKPAWHNFISENSTTLGILATTAAAACIGKMGYELYEEYIWPNKRIIEHCRSTYATIYNDMQACRNTYRNASQTSDWDLKEYIIHTKTSHPFIAYNEKIVRTLFRLVKHNLTIADELKRLNQRKKQLIAKNSKESILFIEEFIQLEAKGKSLQNIITQMCTMLSALKKKVASFKEYEDDYHNWSCEQREKKDRMKDSLKYLQSRFFLL